jgi:hypothetical protein
MQVHNSMKISELEENGGNQLSISHICRTFSCSIDIKRDTLGLSGSTVHGGQQLCEFSKTGRLIYSTGKRVISK